MEKLAEDFPGERAITMSVCWENAHGTAGVHSYPNEFYVFLHNAQQHVESLAEAQDLLRKIFADEIVAVNAYAGEQHVYSGLAHASEPSAGFGALDGHSGMRDMPEINVVTVESWSKGMIEQE